MIMDKIMPHDKDVLRLMKEGHEITSIMVKSRLTAARSLKNTDN